VINMREWEYRIWIRFF